MKTLTKFSLLVLVLATASVPAFSAANDKSAKSLADRPHLRALLKRRADLRAHAAQRIGLSADQISQLKAKRASIATSLKAIRGDSSLTTEQKKVKARETLEAARADLRTVITPDQKGKAKQLRERLIEARQKRRMI